MTNNIIYNGIKMTPGQMREEINKFNSSLQNKERNENYKKFYQFCNKLDEGALIWKWGGEYTEMFAGFHSKKMSFHGTIARELLPSDNMYLQNETSDLYISNDNNNEPTGNLPHDCNFKFYYIAESEMKLIEEIYSDLSEYLSYQNFVNKLKPNIKKLIKSSRCIDLENEQLDDYIDDYFYENLDKYKYIELN